MAPLPPFELDRMILSAMKLRWQKTGMIIGVVFDECKGRRLEISEDDIAERIIELNEAGMINSRGDLEQWRKSEVCLMPEQGG